jgi:hypothetical protein
MKDLIPILLIVFILMMPTGPAAPYKYSLNQWDTYAAEGMVGIEVNAKGVKDKVDVVHPPAPVNPTYPTNHPKTCKCKGTGKVRSGDGIIEVPCPVVYPDKPTGSVAEKVKPTRQVLAFIRNDVKPNGQPACVPCHEYIAKYGAQLKAEGFGFDDDEYSLIRVVDVHKHPEIYSQYGSYVQFVPQFVLIENGKVIKSLNPMSPQTADSVKGLLK